jgi:hypothetical protein
MCRRGKKNDSDMSDLFRESGSSLGIIVIYTGTGTVARQAATQVPQEPPIPSRQIGIRGPVPGPKSGAR